jgi:hypothetical protein
MDLSSVGTIFVLLYVSYFTIYIFSFIRKKERNKTQVVNIKLENLRKIPIKSLDEQKKFLELRYPKSTWKWSFKHIGSAFKQLVIFIAILLFYSKIFSIIGLSFSLLQGILFITFIPILINLILKKFNLQTNDLSVFFR